MTTSQLVHCVRPAAGAIHFTSPTVPVKVGPTSTCFHLNEALLCENSEFFKAALKKEWQVGAEKTVSLPEADVDNFNIWANWIYRHQVYVDYMDDSKGDKDSLRFHWSKLVDLYALGDSLLDSDFKDAVVDLFVLSTSCPLYDVCWVPDTPVRKKIYKQTTKVSKLRKWLVCRIATSGTGAMLGEKEDKTFLLDLARYQLEHDKVTNAEASALRALKCEYHEHAKGEENCCRKKYVQAMKLDLS